MSNPNQPVQMTFEDPAAAQARYQADVLAAARAAQISANMPHLYTGAAPNRPTAEEALPYASQRASELRGHQAPVETTEAVAPEHGVLVTSHAKAEARAAKSRAAQAGLKGEKAALADKQATEAEQEAAVLARVLKRQGIKTQAQRDQEAHTDIDGARLSRVEAANDEAEIRIFGSRGATIVDPTDRNKVIADHNTAIPGTIDLIRNDPKYGSEANRNAVADAYRDDILRLQDEHGLELSMAEFVANGRLLEAEAAMEQRAEMVKDLTIKHQNEGMTLVDAQAAAQRDAEATVKQRAQLFDLKEAMRVKLITEKDLRTPDEYALYRAENATGATKTQAQAEAANQAPNASEILVNPETVKAFEEAQENWTRLNAQRQAQGFKLRRKNRVSDEDVAGAYVDYLNSQQKMLDEFGENATQTGWTEEQIQTELGTITFNNALMANDKVRDNLLAMSTEAAPADGRKARFQEWWASKGGSEKFLQGGGWKVAAIGGAAAAIAVAANLLSKGNMPVTSAGVILGAATGMFAVKDMAAGLFGRGANGRDSASIAEEMHENNLVDMVEIGELADRRNETFTLEDLTARMNGLAEERNKRNKRRQLSAVGAAAIGAAAGVVAGAVLNDHVDYPSWMGGPIVDADTGTGSEVYGGDAPGGVANPAENSNFPIGDPNVLSLDGVELPADGTFEVNPGDGVENTLMNNLNINGDRAHDLAMAMQTAGLMTTEHISNAGSMNLPGSPDFGYSSAGSTVWDRETLQFVATWLKNN